MPLISKAHIYLYFYSYTDRKINLLIDDIKQVLALSNILTQTFEHFTTLRIHDNMQLVEKSTKYFITFLRVHKIYSHRSNYSFYFFEPA